MDKWIPPTVVILLVLIIIYPIVLLILGILAAFYFLILSFFNLRTPPPYLSLTEDGNIVINWFAKQGQKTALHVIHDENTPNVYTPTKQITNKYTAQYSINSVVIPDLPYGRKIAYQIVKYIDNSEESSTRTLFGGPNYYLKRPPKHISETAGLNAVAFGDLQPKAGIIPLIQWLAIRQAARQPVDVIFFLGDHTMEGISPAAWRQFYHLIGKIARNTPLLGVPGNHDTKLRRKHGPRNIRDAFSTHVNYPQEKFRYFVEFADLQVLAFDFHSGFDLDSDNYALFEDHVEKLKEDKWVLGLWHSSPHNTLLPTPQVEDLRENLLPQLTAKGCQLWLGGHEHSYQKFKINSTYFLTSAATSSFHDHFDNEEHLEKLEMHYHVMRLKFFPNRCDIRAISIWGKELDAFSIMKNQ